MSTADWISHGYQGSPSSSILRSLGECLVYLLRTSSWSLYPYGLVAGSFFPFRRPKEPLFVEDRRYNRHGQGRIGRRRNPFLLVPIQLPRAR